MDRPRDLEQLKQRITDEILRISPDVLKQSPKIGWVSRLEACVRSNGHHSSDVCITYPNFHVLLII